MIEIEMAMKLTDKVKRMFLALNSVLVVESSGSSLMVVLVLRQPVLHEEESYSPLLNKTSYFLMSNLNIIQLVNEMYNLQYN